MHASSGAAIATPERQWIGGRAGVLIGLAAVLTLFCAPLFVALDGWDLRSDEALYSYGVDRILETGEWLTPRSVQVDGPFLEKPPLKFWMVAAAIRFGLVPHDETGFRFLDALMGAIALLYIYFTGVRLAGPVCGAVAVFVTFSIDALLFEHGLRSNNMEAALVLAYCGGIYHFMRWVEGPRPLAQALAVALFFVLGFMTKFVAVLFLPFVCVVVLGLSVVARERFVERWRDWIGPTLVAGALITPWFVYQWLQHGGYFIDVIFGIHVYERFTGALDPTHLAPWHFYFSRLWAELAGAQAAAVASLAAFTVAAWRGCDWRLRLLLAWWLVPFAVISLGTSKLFHYAYPFLPPVGLIIGWAAAQLVAMARGEWGARLARSVTRFQLRSSALRKLALVAAAAGLILALVTAISGRVVWRLEGARLLQNSSTVRPLVVATVLLGLAGRPSAAVNALPAVALASLLPVRDYPSTVRRVVDVDGPLRVVRNCAARVALAHGARAGVFNTARLLSHSVYYYLFRLGGWTEGELHPDEELRRRLSEEGTHTIVVLTPDGYEQVRRLAVEGAIVALPPAIVVEELVIVLPGPFSECSTAARAAGAQPPVPRS